MAVEAVAVLEAAQEMLVAVAAAVVQVAQAHKVLKMLKVMAAHLALTHLTQTVNR